MSDCTPKRKIFGYWPMVLTGILLSCILMNAITIPYQREKFSSWMPLSSPPSEVKRIMAARASQVWVESRDGTFFTADISFSCRDSDICGDWEAITDISEIPQQEFSFIQVDKCKKLWNPAARSYLIGRMVECVYARDPSRILGDEGYFALMTSGDVFYWRNIRSLVPTPIFFIFSSFVVPFLVAMTISAVYLVIYIFSRIRKAG